MPHCKAWSAARLLHFQKIRQRLFRIPQRPRQTELREIVREERSNQIEIRRSDGLNGLRHFQRICNARVELLPRKTQCLLSNILIVARQIELARGGLQIEKRVANIALNSAP